MGGSPSQPLDYTTLTYVNQIRFACSKMNIWKRLLALGVVLVLSSGPLLAQTMHMGKRGVLIALLICAALSGLAIAIASQSWAWGFLSGAMIALIFAYFVISYRK